MSGPSGLTRQCGGIWPGSPFRLGVCDNKLIEVVLMRESPSTAMWLLNKTQEKSRGWMVQLLKFASSSCYSCQPRPPTSLIQGHKHMSKQQASHPNGIGSTKIASGWAFSALKKGHLCSKKWNHIVDSYQLLRFAVEGKRETVKQKAALQSASLTSRGTGRQRGRMELW